MPYRIPKSKKPKPAKPVPGTSMARIEAMKKRVPSEVIDDVVRLVREKNYTDGEITRLLRSKYPGYSNGAKGPVCRKTVSNIRAALGLVRIYKLNSVKVDIKALSKEFERLSTFERMKKWRSLGMRENYFRNQVNALKNSLAESIQKFIDESREHGGLSQVQVFKKITAMYEEYNRQARPLLDDLSEITLEMRALYGLLPAQMQKETRADLADFLARGLSRRKSAFARQLTPLEE